MGTITIDEAMKKFKDMPKHLQAEVCRGAATSLPEAAKNWFGQENDEEALSVVLGAEKVPWEERIPLNAENVAILSAAGRRVIQFAHSWYVVHIASTIARAMGKTLVRP